MICARMSATLAFLAAVAVVIPARQATALPPVARPTPSVMTPSSRPIHTGFVAVGVSVMPGPYAEVGIFVAPRFVIDFVAQMVLLGFREESLLGMGGEVHLFGHGEQPRHAVTIGGHLMVNPDIPMGKWNNPDQFNARIGWAVDVLVGWRFIAQNGFFFRLQAGFLAPLGEFAREPEPIVARSSIGLAF